MDRRLFRNEHDKVIAGVSSGIAEYMEVDVTIIRLLFVLSTIFLVGTGILVYLVLWIVVPVNTDPAKRFSKFNDFFKSDPGSTYQSPSQSWTSSTIHEQKFDAFGKTDDAKPFPNPKNNETGRTVAGLFLLVIGVYFLMNEFNIIPFWFSLSKLWPLVFVAIGFSFILKSKQKNAWEDWKNQQDQFHSANAQEPIVSEPLTPTDNNPVNPIVPDPAANSGVQPGTNDAGNDSPKIDDRFTKKDL